MGVLRPPRGVGPVGRHRRVRRLPLHERLGHAAVRGAHAGHVTRGRRRAGHGRGRPTCRRTERAKGDRNLLASLLVGRYLLGLLAARPTSTSLDAARREPRPGWRRCPTSVTAADDELLRGSTPTRRGWPRAWTGCCRAACWRARPEGSSTASSIGAGVRAGLANRIVGGTGDVDSARLAQRLWALGPAGRRRPDLVGSASTTGSTASPSAPRTRRCSRRWTRSSATTAIAATTSTSWRRRRGSMDPAPVYAAIDRLRHAPDDRDPSRPATACAADADGALAEALRHRARRRLRG